MLVTVNVKTLSNDLFTVDIDDEITVKDMKEKINELKGDSFPAANQKLIAQGRIMADEEKVKTYDLQNVKFVVIMVSKPAAVPAPAAAAAAPPPQPSAVSTETTAAAPKATEAPKDTPRESPTPTRPSNPTPNAALSASGEGPLVGGEAYEQMIQSIAEMGYPRDQIERALRASFHNAERAVEYLVSGFPPEEATGRERPRVPGHGGAAIEGDLSFLRNQPQFQQMRSAIRTNPALLDSIIHQLGTNNPEFLRLITENQEEFMRLINEDDSGPEGADNAAEDPNMVMPGNGGNLVMQAQVTPQDREAIERLKALGFPEHLVVEAYFVCDKDEALAVNFLLQDD